MIDDKHPLVTSWKVGNRTVLFNGGRAPVLSEEPTDPDLPWYASEITGLQGSILKSLDHNGRKRHAEVVAEQLACAQEVCEAHQRGEILLPTCAFTSASRDRVAMLVAHHILDTLPLGRSLVDVLEGAGVFNEFNKLKSPENRTHYRNATRRILASLAASVSGAASTKELPEKAFKAWLMTFRNESGSRWNEALWGKSEIPYKCLRYVAFAYGRVIGIDLAALVKQKRSDAKFVKFWDDILHRSPDHIKPWLNFYNEWRKKGGASAKYPRQAFMHLVSWFMDMDDPATIKDVSGFMRDENRSPSFSDWLRARAYRSDDDGSDDSGRTDDEPGIEGKFDRKPVSRSIDVQTLTQIASLSKFIVERLSENGDGHQYFPLADKWDVARVKNDLERTGKGQRPTQARSRSLPPVLYEMTRAILEEGESGWPGRLSLCRETVMTDYGSKEVYCPTLPILFLSLFTLPLRVGQAKRLDSGEGDLELFDGDSQTWRPNDGPNAGYWHRKRIPGLRGYAARKSDSGSEITGFFINTNKTGAPYVIPWQNEGLHKLLWDLRRWQEQWIPIPKPISPEAYVDDRDFEAGNDKQNLPWIFPLFRLPADARSGRQGCPPNSRRTIDFWNALMAELERRIQLDDPTYPSIVKRNPKTGQPQSSYYNPHGLRVAGISGMMQSGVPIEIISAMVAGHASILMTLYYGKFGPAHINEVLERAQKLRESGVVAREMAELRDATIQQARRRAVTVGTSGALEAAFEMSALDKRLWNDTNIGVCPWGGTRCSDGGPKVRSEGDREGLHAPVEGGAGNCVRCRHFFTGPAWIIPLQLYGTKLIRELGEVGLEIEEVTRHIRLLESQKVGADKSVRAALKQDVDVENGRLSVLMDQQVQIGKSISSTHELLDACKALGRRAEDDGRDPSTELVTSDPDSVVSYMRISNFQQAALLTDASRIFPILRDKRTEMARDRMLDAILFHNGKTPLSFTSLDEATKRRGLDAFAKQMLRRISTDEFQAVEEGALDITKLKIDDGDWNSLSVELGTPIGLTFGKPSDQHRLQ